ncbi:MAG: lactate utilization protein [Bacteroidota bacterium]
MPEAKAEILRNLRSALSKQSVPVPMPDMDSSLYVPGDEEPIIEFVKQFTSRGGIYFYCADEAELVAELNLLMKDRGYPMTFVWETALLEHLKGISFPVNTTDTDFMKAEIGITLCECLVSRTGSMLMSSRQQAGRRLGIYPHVHIVVAGSSQLVPDIKDALQFIRKKYGDNLPSMISLVGGASRTSDIEKTLVMGAHGPAELILFLIDDMAS